MKKEKIQIGWETSCDWCGYPLHVGDDVFVDEELEIMACSKTHLKKDQVHQQELIKEHFPIRVERS